MRRRKRTQRARRGEGKGREGEGGSFVAALKGGADFWEQVSSSGLGRIHPARRVRKALMENVLE